MLISDEWRLPRTTLRFKLEVQKQGETTFNFLVEGQGLYNLFMGPNVNNNVLRLAFLVIEQIGSTSILKLSPDVSSLFSESNFNICMIEMIKDIKNYLIQ